MPQELTQERLKELLSYDPETGDFTWLVSNGRRRKGISAGTINGRGYRVIWMDGKLYRAARLAWLYIYGVWPNPEVDHKDRVKLNDSISNLREASRSQNMANANFSRRVSEYRGVRRNHKNWDACIQVDGRAHYLGTFYTKEAAAEAYNAAAKEAYGEFAILNKVAV